MVGLSNVDNTTDAAKPVNTAVQTALDLKAPLTIRLLVEILVASPKPWLAWATSTTCGRRKVDFNGDADRPLPESRHVDDVLEN